MVELRPTTKFFTSDAFNRAELPVSVLQDGKNYAILRIPIQDDAKPRIRPSLFRLQESSFRYKFFVFGEVLPSGATEGKLLIRFENGGVVEVDVARRSEKVVRVEFSLPNALVQQGDMSASVIYEIGGVSVDLGKIEFVR